MLGKKELRVLTMGEVRTLETARERGKTQAEELKAVQD